MAVSLKITIFVYLITDFIHLVLTKYPRRTMFPLPLYIFHTARLRCSVHRPFPGWTWLLHQYLEDSILLWNKKRNDALHQRMSLQGVLHLFGMNFLQIWCTGMQAINIEKCSMILIRPFTILLTFTVLVSVEIQPINLASPMQALTKTGASLLLL